NEVGPSADEFRPFSPFCRKVCHHGGIVEANRGQKQGKKRKKGENFSGAGRGRSAEVFSCFSPASRLRVGLTAARHFVTVHTCLPPLRPRLCGRESSRPRPARVWRARVCPFSSPRS